jgi:hypothetical protein
MLPPRPDDVPVPTFRPRMVCARCGTIGADARPNWRDKTASMPEGQALDAATAALGGRGI